MLLVIDVGNTQTAIGVYEGESLDRMWRVATNRDHTADELRVKLLPLLQSENLQASDITGAALASVVPQLTGAWTRAVQDLAGVRAVVCSAKTAGSLFDADYPNPREIGLDRVADAVAARELFGSPVIVVDFGTATNIEVVDKQGRFLGGIIAPGVQTGAAALFSHATRLAAIDLIDPHHAIGRNTEEALQAGIVYGEADPRRRSCAPCGRGARIRRPGCRDGRACAPYRRALAYHHRRPARLDARRAAPCVC